MMMSNELKRALACKYCGLQMQYTLETKTETGSIHRLHCNNCSLKEGAK
jgi:transcription elongation factor Elf1